MYNALMDAEDPDVRKTWKNIWNLQVTERVWCLMWLVNHDHILTNQRPNIFDIGDASCKLCGSVCETALHALRDCNSVKAVWEHKILDV